jgi:hypothetical protein
VLRMSSRVMCEMSLRTRAGPAGARAVESSVVVTAIHLQDADRWQEFTFLFAWQLEPAGADSVETGVVVTANHLRQTYQWQEFEQMILDKKYGRAELWKSLSQVKRAPKTGFKLTCRMMIDDTI